MPRWVLEEGGARQAVSRRQRSAWPLPCSLQPSLPLPLPRFLASLWGRAEDPFPAKGHLDACSIIRGPSHWRPICPRVNQEFPGLTQLPSLPGYFLSTVILSGVTLPLPGSSQTPHLPETPPFISVCLSIMNASSSRAIYPHQRGCGGQRLPLGFSSPPVHPCSHMPMPPGDPLPPGPPVLGTPGPAPLQLRLHGTIGAKALKAAESKWGAPGLL